ncbi:hypothetical protein E2C01_077433 [Portunus trituberculatus]|uniref:Uncharacterized protein n=1 Tax=Portunus trituberculatus TaxID=210409 RepID=A0A5B7IBF4_PORTR|nr:hypothetical protein [Portunus trituberculatus]
MNQPAAKHPPPSTPPPAALTDTRHLSRHDGQATRNLPPPPSHTHVTTAPEKIYNPKSPQEKLHKERKTDINFYENFNMKPKRFNTRSHHANIPINKCVSRCWEYLNTCIDGGSLALRVSYNPEEAACGFLGGITRQPHRQAAEVSPTGDEK